jgi:hypothetical protein
MSKDVRPVYMGTFEKYKKETDARLEAMSSEQYKHEKSIRFIKGLILALAIYVSLLAILI